MNVVQEFDSDVVQVQPRNGLRTIAYVPYVFESALRQELKDSYIEVHFLGAPQLVVGEATRLGADVVILGLDAAVKGSNSLVLQPMAARLRDRGTPLVIVAPVDSYTELTRLVRAVGLLHSELAMWSHRGFVVGIVEAVSAAAGSSLLRQTAACILRRIEDRSRSERIVHLVWEIMRFPTQFASAHLTLESCGLTIGALNSHLQAAGLGSLKHIRAAARLSHAYVLLRAGGLTIRQVAQRIGCGSEDSLHRLTKRLTGLSPRDMCLGLTTGDVVEAGARHCVLERRVTSPC